MPTNTADQQVTIPVAGDDNDVPQSFADFILDVETRLNKRYADDADRTARNPTPANGERCFLISPGRFDKRRNDIWMEDEPLYVVKATETQLVNNSTALVNDSHLVLPVLANGVYDLSGLLIWDSGTTADIKFGWTGPAGATMPRWTVHSIDTGSGALAGNFNAGQSASLGTTLARGGAGIGTFVSGMLKGRLVVAGTAGNLQLQWAQQALEVVNTRIKTDSWIRLDRVG